jgi:hypothetical protein
MYTCGAWLLPKEDCHKGGVPSVPQFGTLCFHELPAFLHPHAFEGLDDAAIRQCLELHSAKNKLHLHRFWRYKTDSDTNDAMWKKK